MIFSITFEKSVKIHIFFNCILKNICIFATKLINHVGKDTEI